MYLSILRLPGRFKKQYIQHGDGQNRIFLALKWHFGNLRLHHSLYCHWFQLLNFEIRTLLILNLYADVSHFIMIANILGPWWRVIVGSSERCDYPVHLAWHWCRNCKLNGFSTFLLHLAIRKRSLTSCLSLQPRWLSNSHSLFVFYQWQVRAKQILMIKGFRFLILWLCFFTGAVRWICCFTLNALILWIIMCSQH